MHNKRLPHVRKYELQRCNVDLCTTSGMARLPHVHALRVCGSLQRVVIARTYALFAFSLSCFLFLPQESTGVLIQATTRLRFLMDDRKMCVLFSEPIGMYSRHSHSQCGCGHITRRSSKRYRFSNIFWLRLYLPPQAWVNKISRGIQHFRHSPAYIRHLRKQSRTRATYYVSKQFLATVTRGTKHT